MRPITNQDLFPLVCKAQKKWGLHFHFCHPELHELPAKFEKTAPWFNRENVGDDYHTMFLDGCGYLLFDTQEEVMEVFEKTILDEAKKPDVGVYACVYSPDGECVTENT